MTSRWYLLTPWYWLAFIIFFIFYARQLSIKQYRHSHVVKGTVINKLVAERRGKGGGTHYHYYPQYQFTYKDSVYINADESFKFSRFGMGEKIKLIFPENEPQNAVIYTFVSFWLGRVQLFYCCIAGFLIFMLPAIGSSIKKDMGTGRSV